MDSTAEGTKNTEGTKGLGCGSVRAMPSLLEETGDGGTCTLYSCAMAKQLWRKLKPVMGYVRGLEPTMDMELNWLMTAKC